MSFALLRRRGEKESCGGGTLLRLNPSLLQRFQHLLIFTVFWLSISSSTLPEAPLSPVLGIVLFVILDLLVSSCRFALERSIHREILSFSLSLLISLLFFILIRILSFLTAGLSLPQDLLLLNFHSYLLPVLPAVMTAQTLRFISIRSRAGHFIVLLINLILLSFIMSRGGWSLQLPMDDLKISYAFIFIFLFVQILLILSGGRKGRRLALIPAILLFILPLSGLLPLNHLYKNESRKEGGGLLESSLFRFDFSEYLSLESKISMKDDLVFLMKMEGGAEKNLTRRFVLSAYSPEKGFYRDTEDAPETADFLQNDYLLGELPRSWEYPDFNLTRTVVQEYYLVNFDSSAFMGLNSPVSVTPYLSWDSSSFSRIYRVDSRVSTAWGWDLLETLAPDSGTPEEKAFLEYYTGGSEKEDLKQLALEIIDGKFTYYDKVEAVKDYLQDNYFYSLNPGESDTGDQLSHFLFESEKGYCSYFAFSMALLCRSVGIPSRVALGFWVDESSQVLNYYPVKANQAHAWVEVYFPRFGWIEFDPTSQTPAPGEEFTITPFSPQEMEPYLREILENRDSLKIPVVSDSPVQEKNNSGSFIFLKRRAVRLGGAVLVLVLCIYLCIKLLFLYLILNRVPKKGSEASDFFHIHLFILTSLFRKRRKMESIQEYAEDLNSEIHSFPGFVAQYEKIRFGMSSLDDLNLLEEKGKELRSFLYGSIQKKERVRYLSILFRLLFFKWRIK
ncbi:MULTISPECIES: transglutaminase family protein [unclassified Oceanispirochaeta]|uniref:transglutaminase-like domain-containing protein n=1 Tax=unclassified Oceanispirochaeta TaxID=2635722 RepID=UPI001314F752|nr:MULTISPECIES: transglutaminase-like domain-containing protein [unclassified Oceanispirochaeta]MBF9015397.1 transglutaminase domain-containing protein [Oceanispirochaeta sp. M2]NPD71856.1 transglutaminase domain-containing protein [Oceanispirochaeta sp. M1]